MTTRRQFFNKVVGALAVGVAVLKGRTVLAKKLALGLDKVPTLKEVGGSAIIKLKGKEILLIRDSQSSVHGLSPICTHQHCIVSYNAKSKKIECGCHHSKFEITGAVINGPATAPLPAYNTSLSGDRIIIEVN